MLVFIHFNMKIVGVTGFEPATTRPPDVYATGLRYIPIWATNIKDFFRFYVARLRVLLFL